MRKIGAFLLLFLASSAFFAARGIRCFRKREMKCFRSLAALLLLPTIPLLPQINERSAQARDTPSQAEAKAAPEPAESPNPGQTSAAPDSLDSLKALADLKLSAERNKAIVAEQDAVTASKENIRAHPTDGFAWRELGDAYFELGDYKNAKEATEKAVELLDQEFQNAKPPSNEDISHGRYDGEVPTILSMLASSDGRLAIICGKLHMKREARRWEEAESRVFYVLRMMQPSSQPAANPRSEQQPRIGTSRPAQPPTPSRTPRPVLGPSQQCQLPMHEQCHYPTIQAQPYDPNSPQPYRAPDTREYDRCVLGNQREDARYQQCLQQQRERQK
jgi:tetratricopeptide (TPR) repeat protein